MSKFTEIPYWYIKKLIDDRLNSINETEDENIIKPGFYLNPMYFNSNVSELNTELYIKTKVLLDYYQPELSGNNYENEYVYDYFGVNAIFNGYDGEFLKLTIDDNFILLITSTSGGYTDPEGIVEISGIEGIIENGEQVFVRKDSKLFELLKNYYEENNIYLSNINKIFLYLGNIYKDNDYEENHYKIKIENLYFWSKKALPEHTISNNDRLNDFLEICLDKVYYSIYNSQKFIWSLIDAMESPQEFLYLIAKTFNINVSKLFIYKQEDKIRIFINNLIELLKRKGTYSSLYIIGKVNTNHKVNVYERWHDVFWNDINEDYLIDNARPWMTKKESDQKHPENYESFPLSAGNPEPYFIDYNYLDYYNLSISEYWEYIVYLDELNEKNLDLNNLIVECYDEYIRKVEPAKIEFIENHGLKIYFEDRFNGRFCISSSDYTENLEFYSEYKNINHNLSLSASNTSLVISQLNTYDVKNSEIYNNPNILYPEYIYFIDNNNIEIKIKETETTNIDFGVDEDGLPYTIQENLYNIRISKPDYVFTQLQESKKWIIDHIQDNNIVWITQVYVSKNNNLMQIKPIKIEHDYYRKKTFIYFNELFKGFALFKNPDLITKGNEIASNAWKVIQSPHYRVEFDLSHTTTNSYEIFSEDEAEVLYYALESIRPVDKYSHYNLYVNALSDFSASYFYQYDNESNKNYANFYSYNIVHISLLPNCYVFKQYKPDNKWSITHGLNNNVIVQCYKVTNNNELELIVPLNIELENQSMTITFDSNVIGYAFITSSNDYYNNSSDVIDISEFGLVNTWNSNDYYVNPKSITLTEETNVDIEFNSQIDIKTVIKDYDLKYIVPSDKKVWSIRHNLGYHGIITQFFDNNGNEIFPSQFIIKNENFCAAIFNKPVRGYALIKSVGSFETVETIIDQFFDEPYIKLGGTKIKNDSNIDYTTDHNAALYNDLKYPLIDKDGNEIKIENLQIKNDYYENKIYLYGKYKGKEKLYIREMGIFNKNDKLLFYTYCDLIFKPSNFEFHISYEIKKNI